MRFNEYEEFELGDGVYHKSNTKIKMIVIKKNDETKEISCRWINTTGSKLEQIFLFAELIKSDEHDRDMALRITDAFF